MADLFDGKIDIHLDDRYSTDYETIANNLTALKIADVYFLCLILGYRSGRSIPADNLKGKEFRPSYFTSLQRNLLYGFALNLPTVKPEDLTNEAQIMPIYAQLSGYANGGMQWLRDRVFSDAQDEAGAIVADADVVVMRLNEMLHDELDPQVAPF
ncbi:MAG: hypothetical protein LKJ69_01765 [Lactobacillus sp.]|jgi:hypothetical protein|nr:hypothetical protein [Lactobacillus sp.]MCI2032111.1 hypothetical protein [Lactobacillus sp.]